MKKFGSGIMEFANSAVCSDLLLNAWAAIKGANSPSKEDQISCNYDVSDPNNEKGAVIIAFVPSKAAASAPKYLQSDEQSLINLSSTGFPLFEFVCTKVNPSVSINKVAVDHFVSLQDQLTQLKDKIDTRRLLIITGLSLGGSIASLFTLWLLETIYRESWKRPLCITFGSPLLGDNAFQQAISERPTWLSCFLHVISNNDPVPKSLVSSSHMPFGTTLILSKSGCASFDKPESVLELIKSMSLENQDDLRCIDYGEMIKKVRYNAIRGGADEEVNNCDISNPLHAGISLQLSAIGLNEESCERRTLTAKIRKISESYRRRKRHLLNDQPKKLHEAKVYLAYVEWYKKMSMDQGGYYDCYKTAWSKSRKEVQRKEEAVRHKGILNLYWQRMVAEINRMPTREGASLAVRPRMFYGGLNYRRMIEPLDIADFYGQGKTDYINKGRSEHYKLLEQWEEMGAINKPANRNKVADITEDSCFWARVEEAIIVCRLLRKKDDECGENKEVLGGQLTEFEKYVMILIRNSSVSPEIFIDESSFMKWWKEYKQIKGISYQSDLTAFMNNEKLERDSTTLDEYKKLS